MNITLGVPRIKEVCLCHYSLTLSLAIFLYAFAGLFLACPCSYLCVPQPSFIFSYFLLQIINASKEITTPIITAPLVHERSEEVINASCSPEDERELLLHEVASDTLLTEKKHIKWVFLHLFACEVLWSNLARYGALFCSLVRKLLH